MKGRPRQAASSRRGCRRAELACGKAQAALRHACDLPRLALSRVKLLCFSCSYLFVLRVTLAYLECGTCHIGLHNA